MSAVSEWTEEQVALLKTWWLEEGRSAREIAEALAARSPYVRFSRSAVIGKVYRLGLKRQEASSVALENRKRAWDGRRKTRNNLDDTNLARTVRAAVRKVKTPSPPKVIAPPTPESVAVEPIRLAPAMEPGSRTILTVRYGECRWPLGDPRSLTFSLCGCKAKEGAPYCDEHHARAYQPKRPRAVPKALTEPSRQRRAA